MCLITSMLRKQGLIVIWGRACAAAPAHWWSLMMSVFLTVCCTNTGLGVVGRGSGWGQGGGGGCRILPPWKTAKPGFSLELLHDAAILCGMEIPPSPLLLQIPLMPLYCCYFSLSFFHPSVRRRIFRISNNSLLETLPSWLCEPLLENHCKISIDLHLKYKRFTVNLISGSRRGL